MYKTIPRYLPLGIPPAYRANISEDKFINGLSDAWIGLVRHSIGEVREFLDHLGMAHYLQPYAFRQLGWLQKFPNATHPRFGQHPLYFDIEELVTHFPLVRANKSSSLAEGFMYPPLQPNELEAALKIATADTMGDFSIEKESFDWLVMKRKGADIWRTRHICCTAVVGSALYMSAYVRMDDFDFAPHIKYMNEFTFVRTHPDEGMSMLKALDDIPADERDAVVRELGFEHVERKPAPVIPLRPYD